MPVFHYFGDDTFSRGEAYDALRVDHDADAALAANTLALDARTSLAEITAAAMTVPFLAAYRLIRVDNLSAPYNLPPNAPPTRRRRVPDAWKDLPQRLQALPETSLLVFIDAGLDPGNPMRRLIAEIAQAKEFKAARGRKLADWVQARAQSAGVHLTRPAQNALVDRVGGDMAAIASELDKLRLYAADATVDEHVVHVLCPRNPEAEVWDLTDAVGQGRPGPALRALEVLYSDARDTPRLLGLLANQMRRILVTQDLLAAGADADAVREHFRMRHPFPAQKLTEQARRFAPARAQAAVRHIRDSDAAIQRYRRGLPGGLSDELALELLVVDLASA